MNEALVAVKERTYLGPITATELSLGGHALELANVASMKLYSADAGSTLKMTDGTIRELVSKRRLTRPKLLIQGHLELRAPGFPAPARINIRDVLYMTMNRI